MLKRLHSPQIGMKWKHSDEICDQILQNKDKYTRQS